MAKRISFFAAGNDLHLVLKQVEDKLRVKYTNFGWSNGPEPEFWNTAADLPKLGMATADQQSNCDQFLIVERDSMVQVRPRMIPPGRMVYEVYQSTNPDSVVLCCGGQWNDGSIISGEIATLSALPWALSVMNAARLATRRHFTRINAFWVGPNALQSLREGRRLTQAIQSPIEFDLVEYQN